MIRVYRVLIDVANVKIAVAAQNRQICWPRDEGQPPSDRQLMQQHDQLCPQDCRTTVECLFCPFRAINGQSPKSARSLRVLLFGRKKKRPFCDRSQKKHPVATFLRPGCDRSQNGHFFATGRNPRVIWREDNKGG